MHQRAVPAGYVVMVAVGSSNVPLREMAGRVDGLLVGSRPTRRTRLASWGAASCRWCWFAASRLLERRPHPTAVVVSNVLAAFRQAGLRIPQDISVVGFHDVTLAAYLDPPLTTLPKLISHICTARVCVPSRRPGTTQACAGGTLAIIGLR